MLRAFLDGAEKTSTEGWEDPTLDCAWEEWKIQDEPSSLDSFGWQPPEYQSQQKRMAEAAELRFHWSILHSLAIWKKDHWSSFSWMQAWPLGGFRIEQLLGQSFRECLRFQCFSCDEISRIERCWRLASMTLEAKKP